MKKLFLILFMLGLLSQPAYSADQWDESKPVGTELSGTVDNLIRVNNEALDRLVINYKRGLGLNYATASTLSVLQGEIAIPNAAGTTIRWRRTTGATTLSWSDIDTGAEANATTYYVYATADTDITGMVFKISTSSSAPSGMTYYRAIGQFYNNSSGNIENVVSYRNDYGTDHPDVAKGWVNFTGTGTITINDQYNVSSLTDNGTGDYSVNWATSFSSANYAIASMNSTTTLHHTLVSLSASSARVKANTESSGSGQDVTTVTLIAFGKRI